MSNSTTWIGMDVHKERIHVVAVNEAGHTEARWETPNTTKGKGRLATRLTGLGTPGTDGLRRPGAGGVFQRRQAMARQHHQGRQCPRATRPGGGRLALPPSAASHGGDDPETTGRATARGDRDGAQGGSAAVSQIHPHGDAREAHDRGGRGRGAGTGGVCLGDLTGSERRNRKGFPSFCGGRGDAGNGRRTLDSVMRQGDRPQPASIERGSSGRIIVMRSNPRISA